MNGKTVVPNGTYKAVCRGCHGGCVHLLTVEDGILTDVRPNPDGPLNWGRICTKGASIIEQVYHPDRLKYPMVRRGPRGSGAWEWVTWDEAYRVIAQKTKGLCDQYGPESIAFLHGTGCHHNQYVRRFANVLGLLNLLSSGCVVCLAPRRASGMLTAGTFGGIDYYGDVKPAGILVWGQTPPAAAPTASFSGISGMR